MIHAENVIKLGGLGKATRCLIDRRFNMDKIVILSGNSERNDSLIECLRMLFPECEIQNLSGRTESFGDFPVYMEEN